MQALTLRSIESKSHPQTKALFWHLFGSSRGANNRTRIISQLRDKPSNQNQLSKDLELEYKGIGHHLVILEKNNLIQKFGDKYASTYFISPLFEEGELVFDEIVTKLQKTGDKKWSR